MRNLLLLLVLLAGAISGYFIGSYRGKAAIEALDAVKQAAQQEKAESDKTVKTLQEKVAGLSAEHQSQLDKMEAGYRQQIEDLNKTLRDKDKRIADLSAGVAANQRQIESLRAAAQAAADPKERQSLLDQIAQLEAANRKLQSSIDGLKCLAVAVPEDIVRQLQGAQP